MVFWLALAAAAALAWTSFHAGRIAGGAAVRGSGERVADAPAAAPESDDRCRRLADCPRLPERAGGER